jgi:hypothetical protein
VERLLLAALSPSMAAARRRQGNMTLAHTVK